MKVISKLGNKKKNRYVCTVVERLRRELKIKRNCHVPSQVLTSASIFSNYFLHSHSKKSRSVDARCRKLSGNVDSEH